MATTREGLLTRFPEFERASAAMVTAKLAEALRRTDADVFGTRTDDGIYWLAAHLLATSPFGQQARLVSKDGSTTYQRERERLEREVTAGYRVA